MIDLTPLFQALISVLAVIITTKLVPYIKSKANAHQIEEMQKWAKIAVKAAEQIYSDIPKSGNDKKNYVLNFLNLHGFTLSSEKLNALIESEVNGLIK